MSDSRLAGIAAIVFAVLFVGALMLPGETPAGEDPDDEVVDYYEDSANQRRLLASVYLMTIGSLALVVLATVQFRSGTTPASIARAMAYVAAAAFAIGSVALAAVGAEALINEDTPIDAGVARFLPSLGFGTILVVGGLAASAMIAAISADWQKRGTMPNWLCWLGYVCAVILLAGVMFIPMIALIIWAIATGIVLLTRDTEPTARATA
jgi:hypothetical protein